MSYMAAVGYSVYPESVRERRQGAWKFLAKFPDPRAWAALPMEEQLCLDRDERNFVRYLFLRHLLPVPLNYIVMAGSRLGDMRRLLMEREAYQRYEKMACRLGYREQTINRQFQSLLCLMAWAQKPMDALTVQDLDAFTTALKSAYRQLENKRKNLRMQDGLPLTWNSQLLGVRNVLYYMGVFPQKMLKCSRGLSFEEQWRHIPDNNSDTVQRYLLQLASSLRSSTVKMERVRLYQFFSWLAKTMPEVTNVNQINRRCIEAFKEYLRWTSPHPRFHRPLGATLRSVTTYATLSTLYRFFRRIAEWQWPEAPDRPLIFDQDLPALDQPLPRFLGEVEASRFLETARHHPDLFTRVCGVTLLLTGLRQGEFLNLTTDCVVRIGNDHWLRVPLGKMHKDRFIPLHAEVKQLLDEWIAQHPPPQPYDFMFTQYGRRIGRGKVELAVQRIARETGIAEKVSPHRLRHTLATLAINRGMPLESIAALLGHRSLSMTLVYARIGNRTVQQEYSAVSQRLEQLCNQVQSPDCEEGSSPPAIAEGTQMRRLRQEHWRMLGNGYCTRPEGVPCEYETICESCPCFSTTIEFLPILQKQRQDAQDKGQTQRAHIFSQLIQHVGATQ